MSAFSPFVLQSAVATAEPVRSNESRYGVNLEGVRRLISTGPANIAVMGDSTQSVESHGRLWEGMLLEWKVPNGWSGFFCPSNLASGGPLRNFNGSSTVESWPITGSNPVPVGNDFTLTLKQSTVGNADYDVTTIDQAATMLSSIPLYPARYYSSGTNYGFQVFGYCYVGPMGTSQRGNVWAAGDWLTNKSTIRCGVVYQPTTATCTDTLILATREGFGNAEIQARVDNSITLSATPASPHKPTILWTNLSQASVATPWGSPTNGPDVTQNPLFCQYEGIGTVNPGDPQTSADIVAAGNANYTGAFQIFLSRDSATGTASKEVLLYGYTLEDTANTTGAFLIPNSHAGWGTTTRITESTVEQTANILNLVSTRPVNLVVIGIGFNYTSSEWNGSTYSKSTYKTNMLALIERIWASADYAGIPRPRILLYSQWRASNAGTAALRADAAGGATELQADACREIARSNTHVSFIDLNQKVRDRYSLSDMYALSRNAYMNLLQDALHQSAYGNRIFSRMLWDEIMGSIDS